MRYHCKFCGGWLKFEKKRGRESSYICNKCGRVEKKLYSFYYGKAKLVFSKSR